ncbi:JAB domain-containing protein [Ferruginibacter sp. HRS2-29]|uniref:JAB domain-containing protein n=1 Tax=Ferruginibacter sp. HRS2-29 TaxID=2487334 RepID=UPI0020CDAC70
MSEIELIYRNDLDPEDRIKISGTETAYQLLLSVWDENKIQLVEQFYMLMLDRDNSCLGVSHLATGGVSSCIVDPKVAFATALKARATGLILAHNHPSGDLRPSRADQLVTQKFVEAGRFLDIPIIDHLIVNPYSFYSFASHDLIQPQ